MSLALHALKSRLEVGTASAIEKLKIFRTRNLLRELYGEFRWVNFNDQYLENYTLDFFRTKFIREPIQCRKYVTAFLYNSINFQFFSNFSPIQGIISPIWHRYCLCLSQNSHIMNSTLRITHTIAIPNIRETMSLALKDQLLEVNVPSAISSGQWSLQREPAKCKWRFFTGQIRYPVVELSRYYSNTNRHTLTCISVSYDLRAVIQYHPGSESIKDCDSLMRRSGSDLSC